MKELQAVSFDGKMAVVLVPAGRKTADGKRDAMNSYTRYPVRKSGRLVVNNTDEALRENDLAEKVDSLACGQIGDLESKIKAIEAELAKGPTGEAEAEMRARWARLQASLAQAKESAALAAAYLAKVREESPRLAMLILPGQKSQQYLDLISESAE